MRVAQLRGHPRRHRADMDVSPQSIRENSLGRLAPATAASANGPHCSPSGMRRAIVAVAGRMAVIMHRMWADGTEFRWTSSIAAERAKAKPKRRNRSSPAGGPMSPAGTMVKASPSCPLCLPCALRQGRSVDRSASASSTHHGRASVTIPKRSVDPATDINIGPRQKPESA